MEYLKLEWIDADADSPTLMYSELDDRRCEVRKVECFADGTCDRADAERDTERTWLGLEGDPFPSIDEIDSLGPFKANVITREEFEQVWNRAG